MNTLTGQEIGASPRENLENWTLQVCREALAASEQATVEVIQALTGGAEVFCPVAYPSEQLHRVAASFLRIARLDV